MFRAAALTFWDSGKNRFAVTPDPNPVPVLGYVCQNADKTWRGEHSGKILPAVYASATEAAEAILELSRHENL